MANGSAAVQLPKLYKILEFFGLETGAFSQLTRKYMRENFNPKTPDLDGVRLVNKCVYPSAALHLTIRC